MSNAATAAPSGDPSPVLPFHDPSRRRRLRQGRRLDRRDRARRSSSSTCSASTSPAGSRDLWDQIKDVPPATSSRRSSFQTGQTFFAGLSYYGILRAAYPGPGRVLADRDRLRRRRRDEQLPAGEHRHVRDAAHVRRDHPERCTFAGAIAAYLVQKIFFTIAGTFVYLYLFLSVPGSFDVNLGNLSEHPGRCRS